MIREKSVRAKVKTAKGKNKDGASQSQSGFAFRHASQRTVANTTEPVCKQAMQYDISEPNTN